MRTLAGIILIVIALSAVAFAEQGNDAVPQTRHRNFSVTTDRPSARTFNLDSGQFTVDDLRGLLFREDICYTMHTLVVAREKGSDATHLVRQRTCTPASQFRMNHSLVAPRVVK